LWSAQAWTLSRIQTGLLLFHDRIMTILAVYELRRKYIRPSLMSNTEGILVEIVRFGSGGGEID